MSETEDVDWTLVGHVNASKYRTRVVDALDEGPATPSTLADRTGLLISHVSRALSDLRDNDVVELLVPEDTHKGRVYGLTDSGERVANHALEGDS